MPSAPTGSRAPVRTQPASVVSGQRADGVVVVVVTHNRPASLQRCLTALNRQSTLPSSVIIVDNASIEGSVARVCRSFPEVGIMRVETNIGGAGGFAVGLREAISSESTAAVWLMDDDCVPHSNALAELVGTWETAPAGTSLLASKVLWTDGRAHPMNTPRRRPGARAGAVAAAARHGCTPIRSASFVSVLISSDAVREHGLPIADYFLWNDDFEYTARILRRSRGYLVESSIVTHETATFAGSHTDPGSRIRFEVRNKAWLLLHSTALHPLERVLYAGSTVRGVFRALASSSDRPSSLKWMGRGLLEGFFTSPRPNRAVLPPDSGDGAVVVGPAIGPVA